MNKITKKCTGCGETKMRSEFHFSNSKRGWLKPHCKVCRIKDNFNPLSNRYTSLEERREKYLFYRRAWYLKQAKIFPEIFRRYNLERRRRIVNAKGDFSLEGWAQKLAYYGSRCFYCKNFLQNCEITKDHRIPLSRGGTNWLSNLVPACLACNDSKGTKTYHEYVKNRVAV